MPARPSELHVSVEEYLASEERSTIRHEYVDGRLFAMTGSTLKHNILAGNLHSILHTRVKGGPCRVFMEGVKVRVEATNSFYYPDVMVACSEFSDKAVFTDQPVLLVEVLSPSTSVIDRREKLIAYKQIPSLKEYLIVHQRKRCVEIYRRDETGNWSICELATGKVFEICSVPGGPIQVSMDDLYADADGEGATTPAVKEDEADYSWMDESESEE
jgi:Uma2 family endonuclease